MAAAGAILVIALYLISSFSVDSFTHTAALALSTVLPIRRRVVPDVEFAAPAPAAPEPDPAPRRGRRKAAPEFEPVGAAIMPPGLESDLAPTPSRSTATPMPPRRSPFSPPRPPPPGFPRQSPGRRSLRSRRNSTTRPRGSSRISRSARSRTNSRRRSSPSARTGAEPAPAAESNCPRRAC